MPDQVAEYRRLLDRLTRVLLITFGVWVAGISFWGVYLAKPHEGLTTVDALDIAQEARRLYRGEGLTTGFLKPAAILKQGGDPFPPDLYNSPAYVYALTIFFRIFGVSEESVSGSSLFWAFGAGILLFFIVFPRRGLPAASAAFLLYAANPGVIDGAFSGLPYAFLSFLLLLLSLGIYHRRHGSLPWTAGLGLLSGLLYQTEFDYLFLALVIFALVLAGSHSPRWKHGLVFLAAFALSSLPWWIRQVGVAGNPFFSLRWDDFRAYSDLFPANRVARDFDPAALAVPLPLASWWGKLSRFLRLGYGYWLSLTYSLLAPLFLVSIFRSDADRRRRSVTVMAYALFMGEIVLIAAGNGDFGRILAFLPLVTLVAMETGLDLLKAIPIFRRPAYWIGGVAVAIGLYPGASTAVFGIPPQRCLSAVVDREQAERIRNNPSLEKMQSLVKADEVVISDVPWAVAWYANRSAVWIPWKLDQMNELKKVVKNLRFLYLTPVLFAYPESENLGEWRSIYRSGMVPDWLQIDRGVLLPGDEVMMGDIIFERLELE